MRTVTTWIGLAAILTTVLVALAAPWLGRRGGAPLEAVVWRAVAIQTLLGFVLLFAFPFSSGASGARATWFLVSGPAVVLLWLSALAHALWFTWRKARRP
jgi:hypothetical protein